MLRQCEYHRELLAHPSWTKQSSCAETQATTEVMTFHRGTRSMAHRSSMDMAQERTERAPMQEFNIMSCSWARQPRPATHRDTLQVRALEDITMKTQPRLYNRRITLCTIARLSRNLLSNPLTTARAGTAQVSSRMYLLLTSNRPLNTLPIMVPHH